MIKPEQIPHDAYLAAHEVMGDEVNGFTLCEAIAAALNAWPDAYIPSKSEWSDNPEAMGKNIILPLPKEGE